MNANGKLNIFSLLISVVMISMIAAACAPTNTTANPVVAKPTQAPAKPLSSTSPVSAPPEGAEIVKINTMPSDNTAVASKPSTAPAAAPAKSASVAKSAPAVKQSSVPAAAQASSASVTANQSVAANFSIGSAQLENGVSIMPTKSELINPLGSETPNAGDQYLVVTYNIENKNTTGSSPVAPADLIAMDKSGIILPLVTANSATGKFTSTTLKPGEKIEVKLVYEVPQTDDSFKLEFKAANSPTLMWSIG